MPRLAAASAANAAHFSAPAILALCAGCALAAQFAFTTYKAIHRASPQSSQSASTAAGASDGATDVWRGLFGTPPAEVAAQAAPGSLSLRGTIALGIPTLGFAVIAVAGTSGLYAVGAEVGGARLKEVYADHVVLDRNGVLEVLNMAKPDASFVLAGNGMIPGRTHGGGAGPVSVPPSPTEVRERVAEATAPLAMVIKAHPLFNGASFRALVVEPGPDAMTFRKLGLQPGDEVMAVNNKHVTEDSFDVLAGDLKSGRKMHLSIIREGVGPMELNLNAEAAAVAAME
jgi:general secretion pathway protein C